MSEERERQELLNLIQARIDYPGDFWVPNKAQWNFIKLLGGAGIGTFEEDSEWTWHNCDNTDKFMNFFVAGNRSGKTDLEAIVHGVMLGIIDNPYFHIDCDINKPLYPFYRYQQATGEMWIVSNTGNIRDTVSPYLERYFGAHKYEKYKEGYNYYALWIGARGRKLRLKTYEQAVDDFRGSTLWMLSCDEPRDDPEKFNEMVARLAGYRGKMAFYECPLADAAFTHEIITGNTNWSAGAIFADAENNCIEHGGKRPDGSSCGVLEHELLMRAFEGMTDQVRRARQHAEFTHLSGVIFDTFDRAVHVIDPREIPLDGTLYFTIDPHDRRFPFMSWYRQGFDGRLYKIKEWPEVRVKKRLHGEKPLLTYFWDLKEKAPTIQETAKIIRDIEKSIGTPTRRIMDGRFQAHKYPNSGKTVLQEYMAEGIICVAAECEKTIAAGHAKIRSLLQYNLDRTKGDFKLPRYYISSECGNTIKAYEQYAYEDSENYMDEKPREKYKDPIDCDRMMVNGELKYHDPQTINTIQRIFKPSQYA